MIDQPAADEFTPEMPPVDQERIERAVREILLAVGEDPERDGLLGTPARVARMYAEQFAGLRQQPEDVLTTVFDAEHDEIVLVRDIDMYSMCEHHLVLQLLEHETLSRKQVLEVFAPVQKRPLRGTYTGYGKRLPSDRPPVMSPKELALSASSGLDGLPGPANGQVLGYGRDGEVSD